MVGEQRKTKEWDFLCFAHLKNEARAKKERGGEEGEGNRGLTASVSFLPPPLPLFPFLALIPFFVCKTPKIPFLTP